MADAKETLTYVLDDVIKNRAQLANQVAQQEQQIEVGKAQLDKFDALIAALQVATGSDANVTLIEQQAAANKAMGDAANSPSVPASAPPAADAGASSEAA